MGNTIGDRLTGGSCMPKAAPYLMAWSAAQQSYLLARRANNEMLDLMPESQFLKVQGRSLPTSAKQDLPALDLCDAQQPQRCPGVVRESDIDFLLAFGIDDQQDLLPVAKWAA